MLSASWRWLMTEQSFKIQGCAWVCGSIRVRGCAHACVLKCETCCLIIYETTSIDSLGLYWNLQLHAHDHNWLSLIAKNKFCGCRLHLQLQWNCFSPMGCICAFDCFLFILNALKLTKVKRIPIAGRISWQLINLSLAPPVCSSNSIEAHITSSIIKRQSRAIWIIQTWVRAPLWHVYNAENGRVRNLLFVDHTVSSLRLRDNQISGETRVWVGLNYVRHVLVCY